MSSCCHGYVRTESKHMRTAGTDAFRQIPMRSVSDEVDVLRENVEQPDRRRVRVIDLNSR